MQHSDPAHASLKLVHARLGKGPWSVPNQTAQHQDPMLKAIIEASPGMFEGDFASASATRHTLLDMGALTAQRNPADKSITYSKAAFPEPRDSLDWVTQQNAQNARIAEQERAMMARERENMEAALRVFNEPARQARIADFAYLLREHGGLARAEERIAALEEQVAGLVEALATAK